jgi:uncharacterized protein (DUF2252 family)
MLNLDPERLAQRQLRIDRKRTERFAHLLAHKARRMMASPLAFLRGSAPLFYEVLAEETWLAEGPVGEGWVVGDSHLENFGAYRGGALSVDETRRSHAAEPVIFDLNDFDEAAIGPWRFDVVRLTTSVLLGAREAGADGTRALELADALITAYVAAVFNRRPSVPSPPPVVVGLIARVRERTRQQLLDARTEIVHRNERRFVRGDHFEELPHKLRTKAERAFLKYAARLPRSERVPAGALDVVDGAFRVAGTGSLGTLRIALLVRGKGGPDGAWIFDMKAQGQPSMAPLVRRSRAEPAERVCEAIRSCLRRPPRMIGATTMRRESMFVRRLMPQEDKLDFTTLPADELEPLARHLGALLGSAHRRGASRPADSPWGEQDRARLLARAVALAGLHEATYLAYCNLVRR